MSVPPRHIRWASYLRRKNEQQLAARQHDLRFMMEDNARMEARRNGHAPIPATNGASSPPPPRQPASGDVFGRDRQKRAPAPPPTTFEFLSIDQLNELPDMKWIFDGLWPQRGIGIFYGKAGTGKTFIMTDFACKVAHNIGPVLFLSIDDGTSIKTPIAAWHEHHQPKKQLNMTIISQQIDFTNPKTMAMFKQAIDEHFDRPFALILIDGLADVMGQGSLNDLNDVEAVFKGAQMIQEEGLILFIHHERKDGQSFNGSQRLMDKASVFVKAKAQDDDSIMMEWLKVKGSNRKGHKEFVRLKQVGASAVAVKAGRPSEEQMANAKRSLADWIYDALLTEPTKAHKPSEIRSIIGAWGHEATADSIKTTLNRDLKKKNPRFSKRGDGWMVSDVAQDLDDAIDPDDIPV